MGSAHDATRHLAGGGATFDRIVRNLRETRFPFRIRVRYGIHEENRTEKENLRQFVEQLARESGNRISFTVNRARKAEAAEDRGSGIRVIDAGDEAEFDLDPNILRLYQPVSVYCGAGRLYDACVDEQGRLFKCEEDLSQSDRSFGTADRWDPALPVNTAGQPDMMTCYLNTASPMDDPECRQCVWLPICGGGCPHRRLHAEKECPSFRHEPEKFVLAVVEQMHAGKGERE